VNHLYQQQQQTGAAADHASKLLSACLEHELMHVLALMWASVKQFRDSSRQLLGITTSDRLEQGVNSQYLAQYLVTPHSVYALRQQYSTGALALHSSSRPPGLEIGGVADGTNLADVRFFSLFARLFLHSLCSPPCMLFFHALFVIAQWPAVAETASMCAAVDRHWVSGASTSQVYAMHARGQ
jgi:hypothetical protein